MIPCYVSGKGMHATDATWQFKITVMALLQSSTLVFITRVFNTRAITSSARKNSVKKITVLVCVTRLLMR